MIDANNDLSSEDVGLCWNCSKPYPIGVDLCPECCATNPNVDLKTASMEAQDKSLINHDPEVRDDVFKNYGYAISDCDGELRDMSGILSELEEVQRNFSTHAMSEHQLFLQGKAEMLSEVIQYLRRV